jgi:hypothetical protein
VVVRACRLLVTGGRPASFAYYILSARSGLWYFLIALKERQRLLRVQKVTTFSKTVPT